MTDLLAHALELREHGYAPLPIKPDGTKAPAVQWRDYLDAPPAETDVRRWFTGIDTNGVGIITGASSGHLEMLEVEGRATHLITALSRLMTDNGFEQLWHRINNGWVELSPSGGIHWHYRISDGPAKPNTKLARNKDKLVTIETRGQGGFTVLAPSAGRTHATGNPWVLAAGSHTTCPTITSEERDALYAIASMLDETPPIEAPTTKPAQPRQPGDPLRPGDDYNQRASWDEIIGTRGWVKIRQFHGGCIGWRRPGKLDPGISATTGRNDGDNLYVFSSSTEFATETPYSKFAAYTLLEHGGDYQAAAKALSAAGFGERGEQPRHADLQDLIVPITSATALELEPETDPRPQLKIVEPVTYTETDDGNALRLVDAHGSIIRYCPQRGSWLTWDGHKWAWDEAGRVYELARDVARRLPTHDKQAAKHRLGSLSKRGIEAMVGLAARDGRTVTHLAMLDARPYELNTPDGVIDLRTATLRAPDPLALHTRSTNVGPDFNAKPERWLNFLADTFAGDDELTTYIQRLLGVSLIGTVLEQLLPFGFGSGANGKTTLVGAIQRIVGIGDHGYSISAPGEMLLATAHQGHPTEIARLAGARMVVTSELEDGQRFAEAKIKQLTGRDTISGRFMRQDWFSFTPTHTLWLLANFQPQVRAGGPAFWRRLRLLPFLHTVPAEDRVADLEDQLVNLEGPAILAWIAKGAANYLSNGLAEPTSVRIATDAYMQDQDTVGRFVIEQCVLGRPGQQGFATKITTLRQAYETWCRTEGETPLSAKALGLTLQSRFGVVSEKGSRGERNYSGIRLNDIENDSPDLPPATLDLPPSNDGQENWWNR